MTKQQGVVRVFNDVFDLWYCVHSFRCCEADFRSQLALLNYKWYEVLFLLLIVTIVLISRVLGHQSWYLAQFKRESSEDLCLRQPRNNLQRFTRLLESQSKRDACSPQSFACILQTRWEMFAVEVDSLNGFPRSEVWSSCSFSWGKSGSKGARLWCLMLRGVRFSRYGGWNQPRHTSSWVSSRQIVFLLLSKICVIILLYSGDLYSRQWE